MKIFLKAIIVIFIVVLSATTINAAYIVYRTNNNYVKYSESNLYTVGNVSVQGTQYYQIGTDIYSAKKAHIELSQNNTTNTASATSNSIYDSAIRENETVFRRYNTDPVFKTGYITNTWVRNDVVISGIENDK